MLVKFEHPALESDKLWSFALKKTRKRRIWIALCRVSSQVVAFVVGDRSEQTCRRLWQAIPDRYRQAHCDTDFWEAYSNALPAARRASGRERVRRDGARRAMESDLASTASALCAADLVILEIIGDARGVFAPLHPSLQ